MSWGTNVKGQLGTGGKTVNSTYVPPAEVVKSNGEALSEVETVTAGFNTAFAVVKSGQVYGWGSNEKGALGTLGFKEPECLKRPCVLKATPLEEGLPKEGEGRLPTGRPEAISAGTGFELFLYEHKAWVLGNNEKSQLGETLAKHEGPENCETEEEKEVDREQNKARPKWCSRVVVKVKALETMPVTAISAATTYAFALLASGTTPPAPAVTMEPGEDSKGNVTFTLRWLADNASKASFKEYEHPNPEEAEEAEPEEREGEEPGEEHSGPPRNVTRPRVKVEGKESPGLREGETLNALKGNWSGAEPISYEYQWQRCKAGTCEDIPGATGEHHLLVPEDVKHTMRVAVKAVNGIEPNGEAFSVPTEFVKAKEEARSKKYQSITLKGTDHEVLIHEYEKAPLKHGVEYELRVDLGEPRIMIGAIP
jgi:hypothetical protein